MPEPRLRKSPLTQVVCEIRFDPRPSLDEALLLKLQETLPSVYTTFEREMGLNIAVGPAGVQQMQADRARFSSRDGKSVVVVAADLFTYESVGYEGIDGFLSEWEPVATAVQDALALTSRTRTGLRYVNEVPVEPTIESVRSAVRADLVRPWGEMEHLKELQHGLTELRFKQPEGTLTFRFGVQRPQPARSVFVLDFDHYDDRLQPYDVGEELLRLRTFNETVNDVFRWSLTPEQYQRFDPEERDA